MTVVCVDDHPILLEGLTQNIQQLLPNAQIASFDRGEEAINFVETNGCDVLFCEIELCGLDGLSIAKKIKQLNPKVNIIFITVCDEKEHAREVLKIKPSGYLVKPAKQEQIALELNNLRYSICAV